MNNERKGNTAGLVSLILSIVGIFMGWIPFLGWGIVLAALILGFVGLKHPTEKGKAIAGIVISGILIIIGIIVTIFGILFVNEVDKEIQKVENSLNEEYVNEIEEPNVEETVEEENNEQTQKEEVEKQETNKEEPKEKNDVPAEYKSALIKAETYAKTMHMSKSGIFEQLTSEHGEMFSQEAANYAMSNLEFDWKNNALKKAEVYSDTMYLSKKGIYDQLIAEFGDKFTKDEAQYAIDNLKADFNENALNQAKIYQDTLAMSPEAIKEQLTSQHGNKFTQEEADYAIKNLDK